MKWILALTLSWWCDLYPDRGTRPGHGGDVLWTDNTHRPIHCNRMWLNTFYISNIGVRVFLKWSKTTTTSYSHDLYLAGCWDLGTTHPKTVYICQYYGFTSMKMLFYWLIILNNIILMIDNDQSTIIEAPEVYKSTTTHFPSKIQRQNVPEKKCWLWHLRWTCYGQFYWTKLSGYHIHTMYCKFDHSEMIFGPFEKTTFFGEHPLLVCHLCMYFFQLNRYIM